MRVSPLLGHKVPNSRLELPRQIRKPNPSQAVEAAEVDHHIQATILVVDQPEGDQPDVVISAVVVAGGWVAFQEPDLLQGVAASRNGNLMVRGEAVVVQPRQDQAISLKTFRRKMAQEVGQEDLEALGQCQPSPNLFSATIG